MTKRCVYCKGLIEDDRAVDVCDRCGIGVWGDRMFKAIIDNMNGAREKGDLDQGLVNEELKRSCLDSDFRRAKSNLNDKNPNNKV
ncbi:MAG: hypothetical protein ABIH72_01395 [archaeon]